MNDGRTAARLVNAMFIGANVEGPIEQLSEEELGAYRAALADAISTCRARLDAALNDHSRRAQESLAAMRAELQKLRERERDDS